MPILVIGVLAAVIEDCRVESRAESSGRGLILEVVVVLTSNELAVTQDEYAVDDTSATINSMRSRSERINPPPSFVNKSATGINLGAVGVITCFILGSQLCITPSGNPSMGTGDASLLRTLQKGLAA